MDYHLYGSGGNCVSLLTLLSCGSLALTVASGCRGDGFALATSVLIDRKDGELDICVRFQHADGDVVRGCGIIDTGVRKLCINLNQTTWV